MASLQLNTPQIKVIADSFMSFLFIYLFFTLECLLINK